MSHSSTKLPKIIWMLWLQGFEHAPKISQNSVKSWTVQNPFWDVRALSADDLPDLIGADTCKRILRPQIPFAAQSDLIRLELLARHGGVWADATTLCVRPLESWMHDAMDGGFFAFQFVEQARPLSTWFLASVAGGLLISKWRDRARAYWENRAEADEYFWVHYLFNDVVAATPEHANAWAKVPFINARNRLHFSPTSKRLFWPPSPFSAGNLTASKIPVCKLSNKNEKPFSRWSYANFLQRKLTVAR